MAVPWLGCAYNLHEKELVNPTVFRQFKKKKKEKKKEFI